MYLKFGIFGKKGPHSSSISEVIDSERRAYSEGLVSENPSVVNVLNELFQHFCTFWSKICIWVHLNPLRANNFCQYHLAHLLD